MTILPVAEVELNDVGKYGVKVSVETKQDDLNNPFFFHFSSIFDLLTSLKWEW